MSDFFTQLLGIQKEIDGSPYDEQERESAYVKIETLIRLNAPGFPGDKTEILNFLFGPTQGGTQIQECFLRSELMEKIDFHTFESLIPYIKKVSEYIEKKGGKQTFLSLLRSEQYNDFDTYIAYIIGAWLKEKISALPTESCGKRYFYDIVKTENIPFEIFTSLLEKTAPYSFQDIKDILENNTSLEIKEKEQLIISIAEKDRKYIPLLLSDFPELFKWPSINPFSHSPDIESAIGKFGMHLKSSQKILLVNHIRMDGDAWGSLAALALILKNMGKEVRAINDCHVPPSLSFLGNTELIEPELNVRDFAPDMIISLDASDTLRLGKVYETWKHIFESTPLVVIDHHHSNPAFGSINIIDVHATSTCELLSHVLEELHLEQHITPHIATFLYLGLQTDTNMYFNNDVTGDTLRVGAKLIEAGADFRTVISEMFQKKSFIQLKLWEILLRNLKQDCNGKLSYSILTRDDIRSIGIPREEIGGHLKGAINELLINIEGTHIAFLMYPLDATENKVSMRAQPDNNVAAICETFGGGGHILAAGFQSFESEEVITEKLLEKIKAVL